MRYRLTVLILALGIPAILVPVGILTWQAERLLLQEAQERFQEKAKDFVLDLENWHQQNRLQLALLSRQFMSRGENREQRQQTIQNFLSVYPTIVRVMQVDSTGTVMLEGQAANQPNSPLTTEQVQTLIQSAKAARNYTTIQPILIAATANLDICSATLLNPQSISPPSTAALIPTQEEVEWLIVCNGLEEIANFQREINWDNSGHILLVDNQGITLLDPRPTDIGKNQNLADYPPVKRLLEGETGLFEFRDDAHVTWLAFTTSLPQGWGVVILQQAQEIIVGMRWLALFTVSLAIIAVLALTLLTSLLASHLVKPILSLVEGSQNIARGNLSYRVTVTRKDELGLLADSFNQMAEQLQTLLKVQVKLASTQTELQQGRDIQNQFLPKTLPTLTGWEFEASFQPAREVAGDFYDTFHIRNDLYAIVIGDVTDKGVPAAMFMALFCTLIRTFSKGTYPLQILDRLMDGGGKTGGQDTTRHTSVSPIHNIVLNTVKLTNDYIINNHGQSGMFATLFFGVLDVGTGKIVYINGGHESLFVLGKNGQIKTQLDSTGPAVGMFSSEEAKFEIKELQMMSGDLLLGYTDGVTDARNQTKQLYGRKRLEALVQTETLTARQLLDKILAELKTYIGETAQYDDITMLAIKQNNSIFERF
ncbi:MAG: SpoIIE family protein phosphatase [Cyanobacteriota bacterium]|nr:SpoIIE family protein phosphatase [Cyanobacteriota bacterium]